MNLRFAIHFFAFVFVTLTLAACESPLTRNPKNLILFIGDGMGPQQLGLLHHYIKSQALQGRGDLKDAFKRIGDQGTIGLSNVEPEGFIVVDSACSATQIALGKPAHPETVGLDRDGNPQPTILERARSQGLKTGLVSDTRITHATPAAFAAHAAHRDEEEEIAAQILEAGPDVLLSGGSQYFLSPDTNSEILQKIPYTVKPRRKDGRNLLQIAQESHGYALAFDRAGLQAHQGGKILGLFSASAMPSGVWQSLHRESPDRKVPSLREMTEVALRTLSQDSGEGFFLMVEAGQVDWAGHNNDAGALLHEMLHANETLNTILDWAEKDGNTLVVATADHETGGFGFAYSAYEPPAPLALTGSKFKDRELTFDKNFQRYDRLNELHAQKQGFFELWMDFDALPEREKTAETLQKRITSALGVTLPMSEVQRLFRKEKNAYYTESLYRPSEKEWTEIHDFDAYYYNVMTRKTGALSRLLAIRQGVVWSTGSHTSTPVAVFAYGPGRAAETFSGYFTHVELGQKLQKSLRLNP